MTQKRLSSGAISWSLFDWANSAFATSVIAGFFPIFFKDYWSKGLDSTQSTFLLGVTISAASLVSSLLSPVLGTIADQAHSQKNSSFALPSLVFSPQLPSTVSPKDNGPSPCSSTDSLWSDSS